MNLNRSTALQRFKSGNVVEIGNGIMFDFYPGLPHMHACIHTYIHTYQQTPLVFNTLMWGLLRFVPLLYRASKL